jgi:GNAT superfamily N-acetyltransferase
MSLCEDRTNGQGGSIGHSSDQTSLVPDIRCLGRQHEAELCRVLFSLEPSARCGRFNQAVNDAFLAKHATSALLNAAWVIGAFVDGHLRGFVEIYDGGAHRYVEAAFVVEEKWRRRGLGWELLQAAMKMSGDINTNALRVIFCRNNWGMRKLADKARGTFDISLDEISVDIPLRRRIHDQDPPTLSIG